MSLAEVPELARRLETLDDEALIVVDEGGRPVAAVVPYGPDETQHERLVQAMMRLSEPAFAAVWSSPEDDVYNDL
jgi:hypothetical protein